MNTIEIPLGNGRYAIIDEQDLPLVNAYKWHAIQPRHTRYAQTVNKDRLHIYMHRLLMVAGPGQVIDHINGDGLDNRRANLRFATPAQNRANSRRPTSNTSGYKGVTLHKRGKWQAGIRRHGRYYYLGLYPTPQDAAHAYDRAAAQLAGPYARLNFPQLKIDDTLTRIPQAA